MLAARDVPLTEQPAVAASEFEGGRSAPKVEKMKAVEERHRAARTSPS